MRTLLFKYRKHLRRREPSNPKPTGGWEMVYTGFVLILLCFFIMLSSFASMEASRVTQFVRSFVQAVSVLPGGMSFEAGKEVTLPSSHIVPIQSELARIFQDLKLYATTYGLTDDVTLELTEKGLNMRLADRALFKSGTARMSPEARPLLEKIGSVLSATDLMAQIEGHTDNVPIQTGTYRTNWELSTARSVNVLRYLLEAFQITPDRLSAAGFGEYQPLVPNDSGVNRAKNRRVEIILTVADP